MPIVNGRYYMNPAYGAALERARGRDSGFLQAIIESATKDSVGPLLSALVLRSRMTATASSLKSMIEAQVTETPIPLGRWTSLRQQPLR
jgi:hypothetical protein